MKYFVISQAEAAGAPLGFLNAALYDKYYKDSKGVEYGYFPWYAERRGSEKHTPFPPGMVLISKDESYSFDIRGVAGFYIASDNLLQVCSGLSTGVKDCASIEVVDSSGQKISEKNYNAVYIDGLDVRDFAAPESAFIEQDGLIFRIKRLVMKKEVGLDLFRFKGLHAGSGTLICSERFADSAVDLQGITLQPMESIIWSQVRRI
ncbi:Imm43 family immunity protein [Pseudomonas sichuanensis]|uniref:Imm43 family immunity protein n=1 Tax=Pseudomonas TaxID=286 RepID=UPI0036EF4D00